jgi:hypothetical protein
VAKHRGGPCKFKHISPCHPPYPRQPGWKQQGCRSKTPHSKRPAFATFASSEYRCRWFNGAGLPHAISFRCCPCPCPRPPSATTPRSHTCESHRGDQNQRKVKNVTRGANVKWDALQQREHSNGAQCNIASHADLPPPGNYYLPGEETFISSLTKTTNTIRSSFKHVARVIMQHKYNLELDIRDPSSEITHKL